jgi:septum formation protein
MPVREPRIILASASPRRAELLKQIGVDFELAPSQAEERPHPDEAPADYITRIARAKVIAIAREREGGLIIGADTIVVLDGRLIGKPENEADATRLLKQLSGRKTLVKFAQLTDDEIDWYIGTGEPMDKAGAYGIQGLGGLFVDEIAGNYYNVVGLPIPLVYRLARRLGYSFVPQR